MQDRTPKIILSLSFFQKLKDKSFEEDDSKQVNLMRLSPKLKSNRGRVQVATKFPRFKSNKKLRGMAICYRAKLMFEIIS